MIHRYFLLSISSLVLAGCVTGGSNPSCRPVVFGDGTYELCTVGNVILMERLGPAANRPERRAPKAAEIPPAKPDSSDEKAPADGEPVVITSTKPRQ